MVDGFRLRIDRLPGVLALELYEVQIPGRRRVRRKDEAQLGGDVGNGGRVGCEAARQVLRPVRVVTLRIGNEPLQEDVTLPNRLSAGAAQKIFAT